MERISGLVGGGKLLLDPAALFEEPFSPPSGQALVTARPGRLYWLGPLDVSRLDDLPEQALPADVAERLERPGDGALDPRHLPLDHPEGVIARFNHWFYGGLGERAFSDGRVPGGLAGDHHLVRAEAALVARLAQRGGCPERVRVLKLGAGAEVAPARRFFEELECLDAAVARRCELTLTDYAPSMVEAATARAGLDPVLSALVERGQLRLRVLDARKPELAEDDLFTLVASSYLYDSLPQRGLARVGGRWYEFKARPQLPAWPQLAEFRRSLLADDLGALHRVPARLFRSLDWDSVLDPLEAGEVPHRGLIEDICRNAGDIALPLGDALIAGFEALLPHVAAGGAVQTFDLGIPGLTPREALDPEELFKGPERIGGALLLGQNFELARRLFEGRGLKTHLVAPHRYVEEMLGEEVLSLDSLCEALAPEALAELVGEQFVTRFWGCLVQGPGAEVFRRVVEGCFLTRSEAGPLEAELEALGLEGRGFVEGLFEARDRVGEDWCYAQFRVEK